MKNIKKIASFVLIFTIMILSSFSVFAADAIDTAAPTDYTLQMIASSNSVKIGDTVSVFVYFKNKNNTIMTTQSYDSNNIGIKFDDTAFEYVDYSTSNSNAAETVALNPSDSGEVVYQASNVVLTLDSTKPFLTLNFKAISNATATFSFNGNEFYTAVGGLYMADNAFIAENPDYASMVALLADPITVTVSAGSTDKIVEEETFETVGVTSEDVTSGKVIYGKDDNKEEVEMGTNGKIHTIFQKTAKNLTAKTYGVTAKIGGKTYKFPGLADVTIASGETEAKWVIKLILPEGKLLDSDSVVELTDITPYTPAE